MGQLLEKSAKNIQNDIELRNILFELKSKNMQDLYDCINTIDDLYPTKLRLLYEEYDDIFGSLMSDTQPIFDLLEEFKVVDVYETLGVLALFIGEEFENKCAFIFRLFDFDNSFSLEKDELKKTIIVILKGICKIVGISNPNVKLVDSLTEACFLLMDNNGDGNIDFKEFYGWICQDFELQDFLLKYSGTQTFPNANRRMNLILNQFINEYNKVSNNKKVIDESQLKQILENILQNEHHPEMINFVFDAIKQSSVRFQQETVYLQDFTKQNENQEESKQNNNEQTVRIQKRDFIDVMKAWSAFQASDINNNNKLSIKELKILLWVFYNEQPDEFKLRLELQNIDADHSGTIDRIEWLNYLCLEAKTGGHAFKSNMKRIFEKYDKDGEGFIFPNTIKGILSETFQSRITHKKNNRALQDNFSKLIDKLNKDILKELLTRNMEAINWNEFRLLMDKSLEQNSKLVEFLDKD